MKEKITVFSPATVANVSCGYDVLGFCLEGIGDTMTVTKRSETGIEIHHLDDFKISKNPDENVAGIAAKALLNNHNPDHGFKIEINKGILPGSGIGSSAASATGSVFAINELLGRPYTKTELVAFAMEGEAYASKCEHADNLAPSIFGGFTLVKSINPLNIIELPCPNDLYAVILHPQIEIKTSLAKSILPDMVPLKDATTQLANMGSLVHALHTSDYQLLKSSLRDYLIEPHRAKLIPNFYTIQDLALKKGALGCGISGSGPSIYALCRGRSNAEDLKNAFFDTYRNYNIDFNLYVSGINMDGIKILNNTSVDKSI